MEFEFDQMEAIQTLRLEKSDDTTDRIKCRINQSLKLSKFELRECISITWTSDQWIIACIDHPGEKAVYVSLEVGKFLWTPEELAKKIDYWTMRHET